jgi:S-disulfanyl-L-cysteine oxidoreductase SoxD
MSIAMLFSISAQNRPLESVWDGIYTDAQASNGGSAYRTNCASCHGEKLEGLGQTPPLAGNDFLSTWNGRTVGDLFDQMQATMPADRPGQLGKAENAKILSYILKFNRFPSGTADLLPDEAVLKEIRFESERPRK